MAVEVDDPRGWHFRVIAADGLTEQGEVTGRRLPSFTGTAPLEEVAGYLIDDFYRRRGLVGIRLDAAGKSLPGEFEQAMERAKAWKAEGGIVRLELWR